MRIIAEGPGARFCQDSSNGPWRVGTPRKIILAHFDALCNSGVAKTFEYETESRQIGITELRSSQRFGVLRQRGLNPGVQSGPVTACGDRSSLGEATSCLGAVNSQSCLHAAKRNDGDEHTLTALAKTGDPAFASLTRVLSIGVKNKNFKYLRK